MNPVHVGLIGIVVLLILLFSRMPVAFCMALVGVLGFGVLITPEAALSVIAKDFYTVYSSYGLTVVPLFVFMGQIIFYAGISGRLYDAANARNSFQRVGYGKRRVLTRRNPSWIARFSIWPSWISWGLKATPFWISSARRASRRSC